MFIILADHWPMLATGPDASIIADAVGWIAALLTGRMATFVAIMAVAGVGFVFLQGRIDTSRATRVVLGCFIVFGAPTIAAGLLAVAQPSVPVAVASPVRPTVETTQPRPQRAPYDPYAGASVPTR